MDANEARNVSEPREKKIYVEPRLEKAQRLQDVTEGVAPVVTGAATP
jgi:hypothetical protein